MNAKNCRRPQRTYMAPRSEVITLELPYQLLASSIGSQDSEFIQTGDVANGDEENVWE